MLRARRSSARGAFQAGGCPPVARLNTMKGPLSGRRIVVGETRELDVLAQMLERQGAVAIRCPLISIHDAPDAAPVLDWLHRFINAPPDAVVLMTGEGLGRLVGFARRGGLEAGFIATLKTVRKIVRGPKPVRRLRTLGLDADIHAETPTSAGVIAVLAKEQLRGRRIAVQCYPDDPHGELLAFLRQEGAQADPVLPYLYGSEADDRQVIAVIDDMAAGHVDLAVFTSSPQLSRLRRVADNSDRAHTLREALQRTAIAAVGPVVARAIEDAGGRVTIIPADNFHMKPMVNAIIAAIAPTVSSTGD
jgi:uroporphyrinogen-III synthase